MISRASMLSLIFGMAVLFGLERCHANTLYVLSPTGGGTAFGSIDVASGHYTQVTASVLSGTEVTNLAWNPSISKFYTISGSEGDATLQTLGTNGTINAIGSLGSSRIIFGMAYRGLDSTIYAYDDDGSDMGTIDIATGNWTTTNPTSSIPGYGLNGGRMALHLGDLYLTDAWNDGTFGTVGYTNSSTFQPIGSTHAAFQDMVLASDGLSLYGVYGNGTQGQQSLYTIDPATGVATYLRGISGSGVGAVFTGAAFVDSSPVPEIDPTGIGSVVALVTGAIGLLERRRVKAD